MIMQVVDELETPTFVMLRTSFKASIYPKKFLEKVVCQVFPTPLLLVLGYENGCLF